MPAQVDEKLRVCVADFGLSRALPTGQHEAEQVRESLIRPVHYRLCVLLTDYWNCAPNSLVGSREHKAPDIFGKDIMPVLGSGGSVSVHFSDLVSTLSGGIGYLHVQHHDVGDA